jgi:hypothetical protein
MNITNYITIHSRELQSNNVLNNFRKTNSLESQVIPFYGKVKKFIVVFIHVKNIVIVKLRSDLELHF